MVGWLLVLFHVGPLLRTTGVARLLPAGLMLIMTKELTTPIAHGPTMTLG